MELGREEDGNFGIFGSSRDGHNNNMMTNFPKISNFVLADTQSL